jgi:hypothetical protein
MISLTWFRFSSFLSLRVTFRRKPCIYLQTDPEERILRVGQTDDPWNRYLGGTAYAVEAALHGSGNLFFAAAAPSDAGQRQQIEATLIFHLQPRYNNQHKLLPPLTLVEYVHEGDIPKGLQGRSAA